MAVTKIWNIKGRAGSPLEYIANPDKTQREFTEAEKQALADIIAYAADEDKTEKLFYTTGINCSVEFARDQFDTTKLRFGKTGGNVAYHAYQSFAPGEVTPDEAHAIGVQLAKELWGDRFQMVVATHTNSHCVHSHIVINSVSFRDGKKFHDCRDTYRQLREASDRICLEHGESKEEKYWLDWLAGKNFTLLFCDGNHENHDRLSKAYPEVDFHGGRAHKIRENIYHLMRGYVFILNGLSFFVFGGAKSHDISDGILRPNEFKTEKGFKRAFKRLYNAGADIRVENISWWKEELPSEEEMERGLRNLSMNNWTVDYVISHCMPSGIAAAAGLTDSNILTQYLETINEKLTFRKWFFGHYHENRTILDRYIMLYEQIIRIQ